MHYIPPIEWRCIAVANVIGAGWHPALIYKVGNACAHIGKTRPIHSASNKFSRIFSIRCALSFSGVRFAVPIGLVQHKGNKRIGEAQTSICRASPIVIEIAY